MKPFRMLTHAFLILNINHRKNGAPIALVNSPTGSSAGCVKILESKSANIIVEEPKMIDEGSR